MGRSNSFSGIKDVLENIFNDNKMPNFQIYRINTKWVDIIGEELSKYTAPLKIQKSILFISCSHQGWINTLQFYKEDIKKNIKKVFNDEIVINDIKFIYDIKKK